MAVVEEMEELFVSNISTFLEAVRSRMQSKLDAETIEQLETKGHLHWWIADEDTDSEEEVPYLWMDRKNGEIIVPGVLTLVADIDDATDVERQQVLACKSSLNLPSHCKLLDRRIFGVAISYGDSDPVEAVAEPVLSILGALHEADKRIRAARTKSGRKDKAKR